MNSKVTRACLAFVFWCILIMAPFLLVPDISILCESKPICPEGRARDRDIEPIYVVGLPFLMSSLNWFFRNGKVQFK